MTDHEIEQRIKQSVEACTPDVLDKIMSSCTSQSAPAEEPTPISSHRRWSFPRMAAIAAILVVIVAASFVFGRMSGAPAGQTSVASVVSLDVNPSIALNLDADAIVLEAAALNADAQEILSGIPLEGSHVNTAVSAIIGSLLSHGYIDELANSILISVEDSDAARGERLSAEITQDINEALSTASVNASVLSQYISGGETDNVGALAQEYGISHGKAALISEIIEANPTYTFAELSALSVNDLNLILSNPKNTVDSVTSSGSASTGAYISSDEALNAALADAGLTSGDIFDVDVEFDVDHGRMIYDVEFCSGSLEYEYEIDAADGSIVERPWHVQQSEGGVVPPEESAAPSPSPAPQTGDIGAEAARDIALQHAGFSLGDIHDLDIELDHDDGRLQYKVDFNAGFSEYEYEIDAATGTIIEYDIDD